MASVQREIALSGKICELYIKQYNLRPNDPSRAQINKDLDALVAIWNTQDGRKCPTCGVILQIFRTGTLINCEWSRKMTGAPPLPHD